jgi:hypothetical protein
MKLFLTIYLIFVSISSFGQFNDFCWAVTKNGHSSYEIFTIDSIGNSYLLGRIFSNIDFDPTEKEFILTPQGQSNSWYIQKLSPNGNLIWAHIINDSNNIYKVEDVKIDEEGFIFITGYSGENLDIFVAKLDFQGEFVWSKSIGSNAPEESGSGINIDSDGSILVSGFFNNTMDFDPGPNSFILSPDYSITSFLLKLDAEGNFVWAKKTLGSSGHKIRFDSENNILMSSTFNDMLVINLSDTIYSSGYKDAFLQKFDINGDLIWWKTFGGSADEYISDIHIDSLDNIFVIGNFQKLVDFDPGIGIYYTSDTIYSNKIFIEKLDAQGNFDWVKTISGQGGIACRSVAMYKNKIYVTGGLNGSINFSTSTGNNIIVANDDNDGYLMTLDENGNFISVGTYGAEFNGSEPKIKCDKLGNSFLHSSYFKNLYFNTNQGIKYLGRDGYFFILKLGTSTGSLAELFDFAVYPNPTNGIIYIEQKNKGESSFTQNILDIKILDEMGKIVLQEISSLQKNTFDISNLASGLYSIKIINSGVIYHFKLSKI